MDRQEFDNLSINKKINLIDEYMEVLTKEKKKLLDDSYYCGSCHQYFEKLHWGYKSEEETHKGVCVFTDAGYGDDDRYSDVTYKVLYAVCPYCGTRREISKIYIKQENERGRWE